MVIHTKKIAARILRDIKNLWVAVVAIAAYTVFMNLVFHAFCPMVALTGLPCPGCGMTRAMLFLMTGKLQQSVQMHPMGIPIACLLIYFLWNRYVIGRNAKRMMLFTGIAAVLLVVVYLWRMYLFFPNRVPYVYTEYNALTQIFPFYEQLLHEWKII